MNATGWMKASAAAIALAAAGAGWAVPPADLKAKADAYLASAYPEAGPGAAVIIVDDGKTVYAGGRGLADLEAKTPITPRTVFRLGSITKQFSAAVVMQLVDEGKVSLDDPVSKYVPSLKEPGAGATVRQALNHTIGIQSYTGIPGWMKEENTNRPYTTEEMIALFKDLPSPSKPGEKWAYNNSGYIVVGAIIEAATGKPWHQAVEERLAKPLGLATIRFGEGAIPNMAKGYTMGPNGAAPALRIHMSVPHAAGGLVGTVEDLARWGRALHGGKVVSPASYKAMTTPAVLNDGKTHPYGFGLGMAEVREREAVGHSGGIFGFSTDSVYIPSEDLYVAVFTNSDSPATGPGLALQRLAALALGDPYPEFAKVAVPADSLEPLYGTYKVQGGDGAERTFYSRGGKLFTRRKGAPELEAFAAGENRFFYGPDSLTWFRMTRDSAGKPVMEMHQNGAKKPELASWAGPLPPEPKAFPVPRATLARYLGTYGMNRGVATIAWGEGDSITVQLSGQPALRLLATGPADFQVDGVEAKVTFTGPEGAPADTMTIDQGGRQMIAKRVKADS